MSIRSILNILTCWPTFWEDSKKFSRSDLFNHISHINPFIIRYRYGSDVQRSILTNGLHRHIPGGHLGRHPGGHLVDQHQTPPGGQRGRSQPICPVVEQIQRIHNNKQQNTQPSTNTHGPYHLWRHHPQQSHQFRTRSLTHTLLHRTHQIRKGATT